MQRPALVRAIYAEIRRGLPDLPAGEALDLAHRLFRAYVTDPDQMKPFGQEVDGRSLARMPLDLAMSDGGWRVMEYERHRAARFEDLDSEALEAMRPIIEKYLGPEWQHPSQTHPL
jgi:hypothetical protein